MNFFYIGACLFFILSSALSSYREHKLRKVILDQMNQIAELYSDNETLHRYCLGIILKDAVEREDYETANECARVIRKLEENIQKRQTAD
jgi:hypothetical protein